MRVLIVFFLFSFLSSTGSLAAETELETIISTATRLDENQAELIGSIDSVSTKELDFINHQHIQQSLLRVPGVNLHRGNGQEYLPAIRSPVLTGAGACGAFLTAEDGIPIRASGFCNVNELFEAHTEQAKRIEVVRGPGSSLYGSNALHGMINVVTPDALDDSISVELGEHQYLRVKSAFTIKGDESSISTFLTATHDGGFRDESGFEQQKLTLRYSHQETGITGGLSVSNLNQETAGFITGLDSYKNTELIYSNPTPEAFRDAVALRVWLKKDWQFSDDRRLLITPYIRYTEMDFLQHFLPGDPLEENGQNSIGVQSAYYIDLNNNHRFIAGLDAEYTDAFLIQSQQQPTVGSPFLVATIPTGLHYDYEVQSTVFAPFIYFESQFATSWQLIAGLRYEYARYDYDNQMLSGRTREDGTACSFGGCRYSRPEDSVDTFDNWSTHIGLAYTTDVGNKFYINAARSFRIPQATELYRLQRAQNKAELDSVSLESIEIGAQGALGQFEYNFAVYAQRKDNVIFRDSDFFNQSNGKTKHQGLELSSLMPVSDKFNIGANLSYARHRYDDQRVLNGINIDGNDVDTAPRLFGSIQLAYALKENMQAELEWVYMDKYYLDPENLHEYQGHDLFNFRLKTQLEADWQISATLTNVANSRYAERADFTSFTNERYFPGQPRTAFIELKKSL